jgi:hypothetical protein
VIIATVNLFGANEIPASRFTLGVAISVDGLRICKCRYFMILSGIGVAKTKAVRNERAPETVP